MDIDEELYNFSGRRGNEVNSHGFRYELNTYVRSSTWEQFNVYDSLKRENKEYTYSNLQQGVLEFVGWVAENNWVEVFKDVEELKRRLRPRLQQSCFAPDLVYGTPLEGVAVILDDSLLSEASQDEINEFYNGEDLNWRIIVADGDVTREQTDDVLKELQRKQNYIHIVCIVGDLDTGKSTVAWRVAYHLHQLGEMVFHLRDSSNSDFWYRIPSFAEQLNRHVYILVDDIFRYDLSVKAMQLILRDHPNLPITVIATTPLPKRSKTCVSKIPY